MNLLETTEIPSFPDEIKVGWSKVETDLDESLLNEADLRTYQAFGSSRRKAEFLTARHLFWEMIKKMGWAMEMVKLGKEPGGKPFLTVARKRCFVSFSHSQDIVICAISYSLDVGIDAETSKREINPAVVKRILNEQEWKVFGVENPIKLWTMKEAAVKRMGTGLRTNLRQIEIKNPDGHYFDITINKEITLRGVIFEALDHFISIAY